MLSSTAVVSVLATPALGATFEIEPDESGIRFTVGRNDYANPVRGRFAALRGRIEYDDADPAGLEVDVEIEADSIHTDSEYRDVHLRERFFETDEFPRIRFASKRIHVRERLVEGRLTMKGVSHDVMLRVTGGGERIADDGIREVRCRAVARLNRRDFGVEESAEGTEGLEGIVAAIREHLDWFIADEVEISVFVVARERTGEQANRGETPKLP